MASRSAAVHGSNIGLYIGNTTGVEPMREPGAPTRRDATGFPTYATTINEPTQAELAPTCKVCRVSAAARRRLGFQTLSLGGTSTS